MEKYIEKTMENLTKNKMQPYYCETSQQAKEFVKTLIKEGDVIGSGGSVTLKQTGIIDLIKTEPYTYLDRNVKGYTREQVEEVYRKTFAADVYFSSSNAITESGYIYNVDGNSNRVSAILYGPKSVVLVVGVNKIVKTLDDAILRVKATAAPSNTVRLQMDTPCAKTGKCISLKDEDSCMSDGCHVNDRICCNYVVCGQQRHVDRIKVIIVNEELGY